MKETIKKTAQSVVRQVAVDDAAEGQRLDNFLLKQCKGVPKSHLYRLIRHGEVRVNRGRAKVDQRLSLGDLVRIPPIRLSIASETRPLKLDDRAVRFTPVVVYEDDGLIAVDKPAGVAVHGGSGVSLGVIEALRLARPHEKMLELVHRLDRDTSGLLLIAKRRRILLALHEDLREGRVDKRYLALVDGTLEAACRRIEAPLATRRPATGERRAVVDPISGKPAYTTITRLAVLTSPQGPCTLVEAAPKTGRTHQIRAHLASIGYPIVGDDKYGGFEKNRQWAKAGHRRMFLHAARLSFIHPTTGERLRLKAELPDELTAFFGDNEACHAAF